MPISPGHGTSKMSDRHLEKGDALPSVDPSRMRLYSMRFCPFVHRTKLVLEHKKLPHETVYVNLTTKPDWLFELNPLGLVPVLEYKGHVIPESGVCDEFLEEAFPGSVTGTHDLLPSCPYERAAVRLLIPKFDKIFTVAVGAVKSDGEKRREYLNAIQSPLKDIEQHLAAKNEPFFGGSRCCMADLHGYPIFERLPTILDMFGVDLFSADTFPRLTAWTSAMQQLDFVKKVWMSRKMHQQFFAGYIRGCPDYDVDMDEETVAVQSSVA